jgi:hypothetical protein
MCYVTLWYIVNTILSEFTKIKNFFAQAQIIKPPSVQNIRFIVEGLWQEFFFFIVRLNSNYALFVDKDGSYSWNGQRIHWFDLNKKDIL